MREEADTGTLLRQTPRRLAGDGAAVRRRHDEPDGDREPAAAAELAELAGVEPQRCAEVLRRWLLRGADLYRNESSRFSLFA